MCYTSGQIWPRTQDTIKAEVRPLLVLNKQRLTGGANASFLKKDLRAVNESQSLTTILPLQASTVLKMTRQNSPTPLHWPTTSHRRLRTQPTSTGGVYRGENKEGKSQMGARHFKNEDWFSRRKTLNPLWQPFRLAVGPSLLLPQEEQEEEE